MHLKMHSLGRTEMFFFKEGHEQIFALGVFLALVSGPWRVELYDLPGTGI